MYFFPFDYMNVLCLFVLTFIMEWI